MVFKKWITLSFLCALMLSLAVGIAAAGTASTASVWAADASGTVKNEFNPGEPLYLYWSCAPDGSTVDIRVLDESMSVVAGPWVDQPIANAPIEIPGGFGSGYYFIEVNGVRTWTIAVGTIFVVPEGIFGTLSAVGAGLAAFATIGLVRRKRKN
ncbi:MAG: hypothetical protein NWF04_00720 [Candidatus Bathyarchaeota archaeon]|nr:hypothetical protein [Candidatus Bathyarchaeota archaeon]